VTTRYQGTGQVRLGVIGCGTITREAHADAIARAGNIQLQAIADWDGALLNAMNARLRPRRTYRDDDDLLDDPDVDLVLIAVPDAFHVPLTRKALAAGKHVLVEKPLGVTVEECEQLRQFVAEGSVLAIGCNRRFLPGVRAAKWFLKKEGGEILSYNSHYYDSASRHALTRPHKISPNKRLDGWSTQGPHTLDLARHLIGPISAVRAVHREVALGRAGQNSLGHVWHVELRFANGANGQCLLLLPRSGEFEEGFEVNCAGGHATCSYPYICFQRDIWFQREDSRIYSAARKMFWSPDAQDCHTFRLQLESLAQSILTGAPQVNATLEDGIACVKALVAGSYSSLHDGEWVDVETVGGGLAEPLIRTRDLVA
jgi:predicted dehydrogenase